MKKTVRLLIDINIEMSEELYEKTQYNFSLIDYVVSNAFRNNARRVNSVIRSDIEKL